MTSGTVLEVSAGAAAVQGGRGACRETRVMLEEFEGTSGERDLRARYLKGALD